MTPLVEPFFAHFLKAGSRWGVNRTVDQIYALRFVSDIPLNPDEIAETLTMCRSNERRLRKMDDLTELPSNWLDELQRLSPESVAR